MSQAAPFPSLQPPGAGLPWPELLIARCLFSWQAGTTNRRKTAARFARERKAVLELSQTCQPGESSRRALIRRLPGIEDSSRYWSVFMTIDHLRIVNAAAAETIRLLGLNQVPPSAASIAAVKPWEQAGEDAIAGFAKACDALQQAAAQIPNLHTPMRFAHPWFGPLDAAGWYFLAAFHMGLHRRQIVKIRQALRRTG